MTTPRWLAAYLVSLVASVLVGARVVYGVIPPYRQFQKAVEVVVLTPFLPLLGLLRGHFPWHPIFFLLPGFAVVASVILLVYGIRHDCPRLLVVALVAVAAAFISGSLLIAVVAPGAYY
jgi:hypothetical protein